MLIIMEMFNQPNWSQVFICMQCMTIFGPTAFSAFEMCEYIVSLVGLTHVYISLRLL